MNKSEMMEKLTYDIESFFVNIYSGVPSPEDNPNNDNGIDVLLGKYFNNIICNSIIEKDEYKVNEETYSKIENYIKDNFDKLSEIAKNQSMEVREGGIEYLYIKNYGRMLFINPGNIKNVEEFNYLGELIQNIINMIKNS